jgi:hypothetical protein
MAEVMVGFTAPPPDSQAPMDDVDTLHVDCGEEELGDVLGTKPQPRKTRSQVNLVGQTRAFKPPGRNTKSGGEKVQLRTMEQPLRPLFSLVKKNAIVAYGKVLEGHATFHGKEVEENWSVVCIEIVVRPKYVLPWQNLDDDPPQKFLADVGKGLALWPTEYIGDCC